MRKSILAMAAPLLVIVALAGCGSSSSTSSSSSSSTSSANLTAPAVDSSIATQVPSAIKSKGTLDVCHRSAVRAGRVRRAGRAHGDRHGRGPDARDRRGDGPESEH